MSVSAQRVTTIEHTTTLPVPVAVAFDAVNSPELAPVIDPSVRSWRPERLPIDVGVRIAIRAWLGPLPVRAVSEAVVWDPPNRAAYRAVRPSWPLSIAADHRFVARDGATTQYTWSLAIGARHPVARPLAAVAARLFRGAMERQSRSLDAHLRRTPVA